MTQELYGGVEGGASVSAIIIIDGNGRTLAESTGPGTNYWTIGMDEARRRIAALVSDVLGKAHLPEKTKIKCLCLSLSGAEEEASNEEFKRGLMESYPNLCDDYVICSDTMGPIATVKDGGGAVLIAGTGSNALLINPDLSKVHCGGWGYMLGDEGSAYWISNRALKVYFDHQDKLEDIPNGYDTEVLWDTIKSFFKVESRLELLPHVYKNFDKSKFAKLCKDLSVKARDGDLLCRWLFEQAGGYLAKHLIAISYKADDALLDAEGGLAVVCVGSVWKSWDLLEQGFMNQFMLNPGRIKEFSLLTLRRSAALGAAYMAAKATNRLFTIDYESNYQSFHHVKCK